MLNVIVFNALKPETRDERELQIKFITKRLKTVTYSAESFIKTPDPFKFSCIERDTDLIIIEEITDLKALLEILNEPFIIVEKRGAKPFARPLPTVILKTEMEDFESNFLKQVENL